MASQHANDKEVKTRIFNAKTSWGLYNLLVLVRVCVAPFLTGYVHPDEFFQGGQELWFGCPPSKTWEFQPENALRSVTPPMFMTWFPMQVSSKILGLPMDHLPGWHVWIIPRVFCAIISVLTVDFTVWSLSRSLKGNNTKKQNQGVPIPVLVVASAWPSMVLLNRPFTNSMETWILAILFRVALWHTNNRSENTSISILQCATIGALSALGIFTRFTFVAFAFPLILFIIHQMIRSMRLVELIFKAAASLCAFLLLTFFIIQQDMEFYESDEFILTPLNSLSYNSKAENLEEHGLHPRWTHAVVNMMLLYGPLALMAYASLQWKVPWMIESTAPTDQNSSCKSQTAIVLSKYILVSGLGILSLAPHQEPRFLLPLLVPLALLSDNRLLGEKFRDEIVCIWVVFNFILLVFFGLLHQSGIIPVLLEHSSNNSTLTVEALPKVVIFYHTYMVPTFLSRTLNGCPDFQIFDMDGSMDIGALQSTLSKELRCDDAGSEVVPSFAHLVAVPKASIWHGEQWYLGHQRCAIPGFQCETIWSYKHHLSIEDPPSPQSVVQAGLPLSVHKVSCL